MRRRNEFSQSMRYRIYNDSKEKSSMTLKELPEKSSKPLTLKIDQDAENDRLEKIRRRKEFSQLVRTLDVLPKIQKKQPPEETHSNNPSVQALRRHIAYQSHHLSPASSREFTSQKLGESQFNRFIELRKLQYVNVGHVSRDMCRSDYDSPYGDSSAERIFLSKDDSMIVYIPNKDWSSLFPFCGVPNYSFELSVCLSVRWKTFTQVNIN